MQIFIIIALLIAIVAVIFALQNTAAVTVAFLFWSVDSSLALVLLVTLLGGVLISILTSLPGSIRSKWTISSQKKKLVALESERDALKLKVDEADKDIHNLEQQVANLSGSLDQSLPAEVPPSSDVNI
jgi:uncharacterized integral membrane protein